MMCVGGAVGPEVCFEARQVARDTCFGSAAGRAVSSTALVVRLAGDTCLKSAGTPGALR